MQLPCCKILGHCLNGFIGKFGPKNLNSPPKNHVFEFSYLKTIFKGHWTLIFFFYLDNITSLEVPKKISLHISQKWLRYNRLKWRGKTEKRKKQSFLGIFGKNWVLKWVPTVWICGWRCIMMWETKRKKSHDGGSSLGYPKVPKKGPKSKK